MRFDRVLDSNIFNLTRLCVLVVRPDECNGSVVVWADASLLSLGFKNFMCGLGLDLTTTTLPLDGSHNHVQHKILVTSSQYQSTVSSRL